jgi:hypothetical protein
MKTENLARLKKYFRETLEDFSNKTTDKLNNPIQRGFRDGYRDGTINLAKRAIEAIEKMEAE